MNAKVRQFDSGATRNLDDGKFDYEGFLSPLVLERFAEYMHKHRLQADGTLRDSDNWQKGIPLPVYMKSGFRHFFDWWKEHRDLPTADGLEDAICALIFNAGGYLHEHLKAEYGVLDFENAVRGPVLGIERDATPYWGGIVASVPPFVDDEEPGSLKAGEAYREVESYGGSE